MVHIYKRLVDRLMRFWRDIPMNLSFVISQILRREFFPVAIAKTVIHLGFKTPLHHAIAKAESEGKIEKDILEFWLGIKAEVVYDIGGYNGLYGILYAKTYPQSKVKIFEPDLINYNQIVENIRLNSLSNCQVEKVAISDKEGSVLFSQGGRSKEKIVEAKGSPVPTFPLSHYPNADLIKIDVEGAEGKVFRGLTYPANIILELHNPQFLAEYGDTQEGVLEMAKELHLTPVLLNDKEDAEQHYFLHK